MRNRSDAWQSTLPIREAVRQIAGARRTAVNWLKWMDGLDPDVETMIMSLDNSDQAELVVKPFMKGIIASCDERLADVGSMKGQDARDPWENWIVELTKLFKRYKLPTPARKDVDKNKTGRPSPFVMFIRELQELIEQKYWRPRSDDTLADAINRARNPRTGRASKPVRTRRQRVNRPLSGDQRTTPLPNKPRNRR
jgi:hypothetical protein